MGLKIIACGIFRPELNKIIPALRRELNDRDIEVTFLPPGLHNNCNKMETEIVENLEADKNGKPLLLYGCMCHTELESIAKNYDAVLPAGKNCIEIILSPRKKAEIDMSGNVFYLTAGWVRQWRDIFQDGAGITACDKIVMLDDGCVEISDEELLDFFDYIQIPIEIMKVSLNYFKENLINLCKNAARNTGKA
jgi:hypothetical protein